MKAYKFIARGMPGLDLKLRQAGIIDNPEEYVKKTFSTALMMSVMLTIVIFLFIPSPLTFLSIVVLLPLMFSYFVKYVDVKIIQLSKRIDEEIIFAGRFLIIEIESGVPVHQAFENIQNNYEVVGFYFRDIMQKVYLGTGMEDAINETLQHSPSQNLRRILWQVINSLRTGSDMAPALNSVIDQIMREQEIAVKEYGKKLNPLAMFYMMIAVIIPSLGTTMLVVIATFLGFTISIGMLLTLAGFTGFVQMMFMAMIKSSRPPLSMQ